MILVFIINGHTNDHLLGTMNYTTAHIYTTPMHLHRKLPILNSLESIGIEINIDIQLLLRHDDIKMTCKL